MIIAMFLAHLVGDYILQTDRLAIWKSKHISGVLVHCMIVAAITFGFAALFAGSVSTWWIIALVVSISHLAIDLIQLPLQRHTNVGTLALTRFLVDQALHLCSILAALSVGGYSSTSGILPTLASEVNAYPLLAYLAAYAALAMPAWVWLEFFGYGIVQKSPPNFAQATNKYVSSLERWLIATCVILGQYLLIPIVAAPRVILEKQNLTGTHSGHLYLIKLLASVGLALAVGLALKQM